MRAKGKIMVFRIPTPVTKFRSIVFSFWKKSLDIVGILLKEKGVPHLRVDGTLPLGLRKRVLDEFQIAAQGMVLLMTLGTGAIGLVTQLKESIV